MNRFDSLIVIVTCVILGAYTLRDLVLTTKVREALPAWARLVVGILDFVLDLPKVVMQITIQGITWSWHLFVQIPAVHVGFSAIGRAWHSVATTYVKASKRMAHRPFYGPFVMSMTITGTLAAVFIVPIDDGVTSLTTRIGMAAFGFVVMLLGIFTFVDEARQFDPVRDDNQPPVDSYQI